ncbi:MAG: filamentous hemagglutinin N-terminal domain-containing protein, partial [Nitrospirota bacterium]|nr:filamentous hemagglutinin N-terminal domain-containing protein [Nitrospirota bacterium]
MEQYRVKQKSSIRPRIVFTIGIGIILAIGFIPFSKAQQTAIIPDSSLPENSQVNILIDQAIQPPGTAFNITGGKQIGPNLFHSFSQFSIGDGHIADFVGRVGINNILSRVTGNNLSNIFGTLRSTSSANLFLLNPNGIVFGPKASLDIKGSFHFSTADFLRLGEGTGSGIFSASEPSMDILTAASPSAFGFLSSNPGGGIDIQSNLPSTSNALFVAPGKTLAFIGGDVEIGNRTISTVDGSLSIVSVKSTGEVLGSSITDSDFETFSFSELGDIRLTNSALNASSNNATGTSQIKIIGGKLILQDGTSISTLTEANGDGGNIIVHAESITANLDDSGAPNTALAEVIISTESTGDNIPLDQRDGTAGEIRIEAQEKIHLHNTSLTTTAKKNGGGGDISLTTLGDESNLYLTDTLISASVKDTLLSDPSLNLGNISLASPSLEIAVLTRPTGGIIGGTTGSRNAGNINLDVEGILTLKGSSATPSSPPIGLRILNRVGANAYGNGGEITISAGELNLTSVIIDSSTFFQPDPFIPVNPQAGTGGNLTITADNMTTSRSQIFSGTFGVGDGGTVQLNIAKTLFLKDFSKIETKTSAPQLFSVQTPSTATIEKAGTGGTVLINTDSFKLFNSTILADTIGPGNAGNIEVNSESLFANVVELDNPIPPALGLVTISSSSSGVDVDGDGKLNGPFDIRATGNAGQIIFGEGNNDATLSSIRLFDTTIRTESKGTGAGGPITLASSQALTLTDTTLSANVTDETGSSEDPANITLTTPDLTITGGGLTAQTTGTRDAGQVILNVGALTTGLGTKEIKFSEQLTTKRVQLSSSSTSTNAGAGNAGSVTIQGEDSVPAGPNGTPAAIPTKVAGLIQLADTDISTEANSDGAGGPITLASSQALTLTDTTLSANVTDETGSSEDPANITLTT